MQITTQHSLESLVSRRGGRFALVAATALAGLAGLALASGPAGAQSATTGLRWPQGQALPTFAAAKNLDVADIEGIPGDEQLLLTTLQGIVNRREPRIYLLQPSDEGKETWLKDGLGVRYTTHDNAWALMDKYRSEVRGVIVYDPAVPDTVNVATTLAGLKDSVVVSPNLLNRLTKAPYSLPVIEDLRTRKFRNRLDAYLWQYSNLWSQTTHRMLIGLSPTHTIELQPEKPVRWQEILREREPVQDAANRETRTADLTPFLGHGPVYVRISDSEPTDGWGGAVHEIIIRANGREVGRFVPGMPQEAAFMYDAGGSQVSPGHAGHRFADNGNFFVYKITPPDGTTRLEIALDIWNQFRVSATSEEPKRTRIEEPYGFLRDYAVANRAMVFWLDPNITAERTLLERILGQVEPYTPYLGWFAQDVAGEFGGTELVSRYGVYVLAADWFSNMTVFSGARAANRPPKAPPTPKLENKVYVSLVMSEGDNLQYNEHRMRRLWDDPARGRVPITWTTTPLLLDAAPSILSYFQRTATPNDVLVAGPSGAGYIYVTPWPDATFDVFARQTAKYNRKTGMSVVYALNRVDGRDVPLEDSKARAYAEIVQPKGLFIHWGDSSVGTYRDKGMPQSTIWGTGSANGVRQAIRKAVQEWDGKSPKFVGIGVLAWSTTPSDLAEMASTLGPEVQIVRGDHFFDLMRAARSASPKSAPAVWGK